MNELTIIKCGGGAYVDSREVAEAIGKPHRHLLRDIRRYSGVIEKIGAPNFGLTNFFHEAFYLSAQNKEMPCFLITKMGCEMIANKLTGEKGIQFTAAYIAKFNEMEAAERDAEIKANATPRLSEFNSAVKNVLGGMAYCQTAPGRVLNFLRGVYEPLGIEVQTDGDEYGYYTATQIAGLIGVYSDTGRPHGHAVSAIISKLENPASHAMVIPYGLVGVTIRYDSQIVDEVQKWITDHGFPSEVPYLNFFYHINYDCKVAFYSDKSHLDDNICLDYKD